MKRTREIQRRLMRRRFDLEIAKRRTHARRLAAGMGDAITVDHDPVRFTEVVRPAVPERAGKGRGLFAKIAGWFTRHRTSPRGA